MKDIRFILWLSLFLFDTVTRNTQRIRYIQERCRGLLRIVNLTTIQSNRLTLNILSVKPIDIKHIALFYYKH